MNANIFLVNKSVINNKELADKIYSLKRTALDPRAWYELTKVGGLKDAYNQVIKREITTISRAEELVSGILGAKVRFTNANYLFALDTDTWKDRKRNSAILHSPIYTDL